MVRVSFLYPNEPGKKFDHDYYAYTHMPLVQKRMSAFGLVRYEVDKAAAEDAPFLAACHLYFDSVAQFRSAVAQHGEELMSDIPNYTPIQAQLQISEIVV